MLFFLAALNFVIVALLGAFTKSFVPTVMSILPDCILLVIIGFLYKKYKSRTISVALFLYSISILFITFMNFIGQNIFPDSFGGKNVFIAILLFFVTFKSMQASFNYYKLKNYGINWKNWIIKTILFVIVALFWLFILMVLYVIYPNISDTLYGLLFISVFLLPMYFIYAGIFPWGKKLQIKYIKTID